MLGIYFADTAAEACDWMKQRYMSCTKEASSKIRVTGTIFRDVEDLILAPESVHVLWSKVMTPARPRLEAFEKNIDAFFLLAAILSVCFTLRELARTDDFDGIIATLAGLALMIEYVLFTSFLMFVLAMMFLFADLYSVSPIIGLLCLAVAIVQTLRSIRHRRITMAWGIMVWLFVYPLLFLIARIAVEVTVASFQASFLGLESLVILLEGGSCILLLASLKPCRLRKPSRSIFYSMLLYVELYSGIYICAREHKDSRASHITVSFA